MPKLWTETMDTHRQAVRDAILDATARLVARQGIASVTMSGVAEAAGIGRATLYKYFADLDAILVGWHERHVASHLAHLAAVRDAAPARADRLLAILEAYAFMLRSRGPDPAPQLHVSDHVVVADQQLRALLAEVVTDSVALGQVRPDMPTAELVSFCLNALAAAQTLASDLAVQRLVALTLAGLRPPN